METAVRSNERGLSWPERFKRDIEGIQSGDTMRIGAALADLGPRHSRLTPEELKAFEEGRRILRDRAVLLQQAEQQKTPGIQVSSSPDGASSIRWMASAIETVVLRNCDPVSQNFIISMGFCTEPTVQPKYAQMAANVTW